MNSFGMSSASQSADWLFFGMMLLAIGLGITGFIVWFYLSTKSSKRQRRKRRHRHDRKHNPTLAETGGLPSKREHDQPPRGA